MTVCEQPDRSFVGIGDHISHSQVTQYTMCSLKWWFSKNFIPDFVAAVLVFGRAIHAGIEVFYQQRLRGSEATIDDMMSAFDQVFAEERTPIQYGAKESVESLRDKAGQMFQTVLDNIQPSTVLAIEQPFRIRLSDDIPDVLGYIDLIEIVETDDGPVIELIDFKTAAKKQNDMPADQLHLYEMAVQATGLVKDFDLPIRLGFRVITKTKDPDFQILNVESSTQQQDRLKAKMGACVKGMKAGIVYPNPGWQCGSCPFKRHCAVWPDVDSIAGTFPRKI
jgi:putative RecB family exonuclease